MKLASPRKMHEYLKHAKLSNGDSINTQVYATGIYVAVTNAQNSTIVQFTASVTGLKKLYKTLSEDKENPIVVASTGHLYKHESMLYPTQNRYYQLKLMHVEDDVYYFAPSSSETSFTYTKEQLDLLKAPKLKVKKIYAFSLKVFFVGKDKEMIVGSSAINEINADLEFGAEILKNFKVLKDWTFTKIAAR